MIDYFCNNDEYKRQIQYQIANSNRNFSKENRITIILMVAGATVIYEMGIFLLRCAIVGISPEIVPAIKIIAIEIVYNVLLSIIFYPLIQKAGFAIDRVFKRNNMLK